MKKVLWIIGIIFCFTPNLFATTVVPLTCANVSSLPSGNNNLYAKVTLESQAGDRCVQITVKANETAIPIASDNYGIFAFGFNYSGDPANLVVTGLPDNTWSAALNQRLDGYSTFEIGVSTNGNTRVDPLSFTVCLKEAVAGTLTEADLNATNSAGKTFVAHIGGFSIVTTSGTTTSAYFADACPVTLIELSDFKAIPGNGQVTVTWETATEIDNMGFNLYRSEKKHTGYEKINDELILTTGSGTQGASYQFIDTPLKNRKVYYYKLEDIDIYGNKTMNGPEKSIPRWIFGIFGK
jgi:hypothetical protein